jgi:hypothetical protein
VVAQSGRAYIGAANTMRLEMFDSWVKNLSKKGAMTPEQMKEAASAVKTLTGQGEWGKNIKNVNKAFFALRYALSQVETATFMPLLRAVNAKNKPLAKLILKKYARAYATGLGVLGGAEYMMGGFKGEENREYKIDLSPSSANYGRFVWQKSGGEQLAIDLVPPFMKQQAILFQIGNMERESAKGKVAKGAYAATNMIGQQMQNKAAPAISIPFQIYGAQKSESKESFGQSFDFENKTGEAVKNTAFKFGPISIQTIKEIIESEEFTPEEKAFLSTLPILLRTGVQEGKPRE